MQKPCLPVRSFLLWVLTFSPLLLTSYISPDFADQGNNLPEGTCHLILAMGLRGDVTGSMEFETSLENAKDGKTYSVLTLRMINAQTGNLKSLDFLISRQHNADGIGRGSYKIGVRSEGFLPYFDGIFGFAISTLPGELPFFASEGTINITHAYGDQIDGNMEVVFMNTNSKQLIIKGIFKAIKAELR